MMANRHFPRAGVPARGRSKPPKKRRKNLMKTGKTLTDLAAELERQNQVKQDFIIDTSHLTLAPTPNDVIMRMPAPAGSDAGEPLDFNIDHSAHRQIATRLSIPQKYYDRMREAAPMLLSMNVNHWFRTQPERRMVRTLDGHARAFLSDGYRMLDNYDLANVVLPVLQEQPDVQIASCEITDMRMYIKAIFPRIEGGVKKGVEWMSKFDIVQAGICISNSEIGHGSLRVEPLIYTPACMNGMILCTAIKKYHVGRKHAGEEAAFEVLADDTKRATDKAFWMQVRDVVRASFNDVLFQEAVERMRDAAALPIKARPVEVVERVTERYSLTTDESDNVLDHLIRGGDLSQWGLISAVTRASQDVDDYDRATEFERLGGTILELPRKDWQVLAEAAYGEGR